jgi:transposase
MCRERTLPNIENCSFEELEKAIESATSMASYTRLTALRGLLLGHEFEDLCELFRVTDRTMETWIYEFNEQGLDGIIDRPRSGRPRAIAPEKFEQYRELIKNPNLADEHFWTGKKLHFYLTNELREELSYATTMRFLHEQGFVLKVPRSWPAKQDEEKRTAYLAHLLKLQNDTNVEIWYQDETGIEGDPRPRRRWAPKGSRPTIPYMGTHIRMNICGMVQPASGEFACLEFDYMDRDSFQVFLDYANEIIKGRNKKQIMILDNASWHKVSNLDWGEIEPFYLPPYSPDFNPIERLWLRLKCDYFQDFIAKTYQELAQQADYALARFNSAPGNVASICAVRF